MRRIDLQIILLQLLRTLRFSHCAYFVPLGKQCESETSQPVFKEIEAPPVLCVNKCMMKGCQTAIVEGNKCFIEEGGEAIPSTENWIMKAYDMKFLANVAINKDASASSIYSSSDTPPNGADEDMNTLFHSHNEQSPWWMVDLGEIFMVKRVNIIGRSHQYVRMGDLKIYVSETSPTSGSYSSLPLFAEQIGVPPTSSNQYVGLGLCGRYVVVQKQDYGILEFYEFEVYGI